MTFHAAFAVFGIQRIVEYSLEGWRGLLPWVTPSIVGITAIQLGQAYYRRRFAAAD